MVIHLAVQLADLKAGHLVDSMAWKTAEHWVVSMAE